MNPPDPDQPRMASPRKKVVIVFGLLSCRSSAAAISQFARAVAPHAVIVHHDFSQVPELRINENNVVVLDNPEQTAWGNWSLVAATFKLIEHALGSGEWDYFQLVSESCLPVRPISAFEDYLLDRRPDAMVDMQPLRAEDPVTVMNYGWRYLPRSSHLTRFARRAGLWWIGTHHTLQARCGGNVKVPATTPGTATGRAMRRLGRAISTAFLSRHIGAFPLAGVADCWVGGQWFGVSRATAARLVVQRARTPALEAHFRRCPIPDESYLHTVLAHSKLARIAPGNHVTIWDGGKFGPDQLTLADIPRVVASGRFFARKLALDPSCSVRRQLLQCLHDQAAGRSDEDAAARAAAAGPAHVCDEEAT